MSANSLPALPTEIVTQIFKSTDDFSTATALSSTSHRFQSIWKTNAASICHNILVRTIACYDQALEYVKAQPLNAASSEPIGDTSLLAIKVTKQFLKNADIASLALQYYEAHVLKHISTYGLLHLSSFTEAQRTCFLQAWYRIHALASLAEEFLPCNMLAAMDLLEFEQMWEALRWLMYWCPDEHRSELRISFQDGCLEGLIWFRLPKSPISAQRWSDLMNCLTSVDQDLHKSPLDHRSRDRGEMVMVFFQYMVHESYLDIKESGKGVSLADMLPLIEERNTSDQRYRLTSGDQVQ